jgi:hypothetical protein
MTKLNELLAAYQNDRSQIKYRRSGVRYRLSDDPKDQVERLADELERTARWRIQIEEALSAGIVSSTDLRKLESDMKAVALHIRYRLLASATEIAVIIAGLAILTTLFAMDHAPAIVFALGTTGIIFWQVIRRKERLSIESRARAALEFAQICRGARAATSRGTRTKKTS